MDSKRVVACLLENPFPDFEMVYLMGNHEQVLLDFLAAPHLAIAQLWLQFGGLATLSSYGVQLNGIPTQKELVGLQRELREKIPEAHRFFMQGLRLSYEKGGYFFAHAGVRPKVKLQRQRPEDLLWIRDEFLQSRRFHGKVIVHGHSVTPTPDVHPNRIGLDTGAYVSGILTCAVFEADGHRFL